MKIKKNGITRSNVYVAFSYDTEMAVPQDLPHLSKEQYDALNLEEKQQQWASYIREGVWEDPEHLSRSMRELEVVHDLARLFRIHDSECTVFILGQWLDTIAEYVSTTTLRDAFLNYSTEIGSHSYHHKTFLGTGDPVRDAISPPLSPQEVGQEIAQANASIQKHLGVTPVGLRTPMGNLSAFKASDTHILHALQKNGIQYVSSWLKKEKTTPNSPCNAQPFCYAQKLLLPKPQYGDLVEIPGVGYYDVHLNQPTRLLVFNEGTQYTLDEMADYYVSVITDAVALAKSEKRPVFVPFVFHPWAVAQYDPQLKMHERILETFDFPDVTFCSYHTISEMVRPH